MILDFLTTLLPKNLFFQRPDLVTKAMLDLPLSLIGENIQVGDQPFAIGQKVLIQEERTGRYGELQISLELVAFLRTVPSSSLPLYKLRSANEQLYFAVFKPIQALLK